MSGQGTSRLSGAALAVARILAERRLAGAPGLNVAALADAADRGGPAVRGALRAIRAAGGRIETADGAPGHGSLVFAGPGLAELVERSEAAPSGSDAAEAEARDRARRIEAFWRERGRTVRVRVVKEGFEVSNRATVWGLRSEGIPVLTAGAR